MFRLWAWKLTISNAYSAKDYGLESYNDNDVSDQGFQSYGKD